jgi:hypothetical protein
MSRKHFSWLFALTVAVAVVIGLLPERVGRESTFEVRLLLPELAGSVNEIDEISIVRGGEQAVATMHRSEAGWSVEEAGGYPADWPRLRSLLVALAQAQVVEPKTANPEYYDRLGLRDVAEEESKALRVRIGAGADAPALLVGDAAPDRDGQYVRLEGEDRAFLIDRALEVPRETRDWLNRQIVDIGEAEVVEVEITQADGERVLLKKRSADDADFVLQNLPEGREVQSSWTVNAPGGGLADLRLDEVRPAEDIDIEQAVRLRMLTADGLQVDAELAEVDERHWIRLQASVHTPAAAVATADEAADRSDAEAETARTETPDAAAPDATAPGAPAADASVTEAPPGDEAAGAPSEPDPAERAATINQRVEGWVYAIPQYKFDVLTRRPEDMLKQLEPAD